METWWNVLVLVEICTVTLQKAVIKEIIKGSLENRASMRLFSFIFSLYANWLSKTNYQALLFNRGWDMQEHSYRMETIWLFLTVLFAHSFKLFSCDQKRVFISHFIVQTKEKFYPLTTVAPTQWTQQTGFTEKYLFVLTCVKQRIWVFILPAWDHMFLTPFMGFTPFSPLSLFQRGKEWATFGHQTGTWEHGSGVQKDSARGNALKSEGALHTHCASTQKPFHEITLFHMLFLLVPYYFASAALPGFNQPASDLTH